MVDKRILISYLALLAFHVAHVFEEVWGGFRVMQTIGAGWFLIVNWVLFLIPLVFLYLILTGKRAGYYLSMAYGALMVLNGIGHNIGTIIIGHYPNEFAGAYSGVGLIIFGAAVVYYLRQMIKDKVHA